MHSQNSSLATTVAATNLRRPLALSPLLSAAFPVPETSIVLFPGNRGPAMPKNMAVKTFAKLMNRAWRDVAEHGRALRFPEYQVVFDDPAKTRAVASVHSKLAGAEGLMTDTDLAEAVIGIVYYVLQEGFYATKYSVARVNRGGRRLLGDIELFG